MEILDLKKQILEAKKALYKSQVIAFPTETVMGLGVIYDDYNAYLELNRIKNRREDKPYTMMVKSTKDISLYAYDGQNYKVIQERDGFYLILP